MIVALFCVAAIIRWFAMVKVLSMSNLFRSLVLLGLLAILSFAPALAGGPTAKGNTSNEYALETYLFNLYNQQKQDQFNQLPKAEQSPPRVLPPG